MAREILLLQEGFRPLLLTEWAERPSGAERPSMGRDSLFEYTLEDRELEPGELMLMERKIHTKVPNGKDKFMPTDVDWLRGQTRDLHAKVNKPMEDNTERYYRPRTHGSLALEPVPEPVAPAKPEYDTEVIDLNKQFEKIGKKKGIARRHVKPKEIAQATFYGILLGLAFKAGDFVRSTFFPNQPSGNNEPIIEPARTELAEISPVPPIGTSTEVPPLPTLTVTPPPSEIPPSRTVPPPTSSPTPEMPVEGSLVYQQTDGDNTFMLINTTPIQLGDFRPAEPDRLFANETDQAYFEAVINEMRKHTTFDRFNYAEGPFDFSGNVYIAVGKRPRMKDGKLLDLPSLPRDHNDFIRFAVQETGVPWIMVGNRSGPNAEMDAYYYPNFVKNKRGQHDLFITLGFEGNHSENVTSQGNSSSFNLSLASSIVGTLGIMQNGGDVPSDIYRYGIGPGSGYITIELQGVNTPNGEAFMFGGWSNFLGFNSF